MGNLMLKVTLLWDRLVFNMGILILVRQYLYIQMAPDLSYLVKTVVADELAVMVLI